MKKLILIVIFFALTGAVFAQVTIEDIKNYLPPNLINWESPTSVATGGLFTSETDDFIDPSFYGDVEFEKFFGMTSYKDTNRVNIGFATKVKDLYIGAYYGGKFWAGKVDFPYTEQTFNGFGYPRNGVRVYDFDVDVTDPANPKINPLEDSRLDNEVSLLIGAANMGFRLSLATTYQSFSDSDFGVKLNVSGTTIPLAISNAEFETGYIAPQIAWGMAKDLTDNGIRPYLTFQLGFYRDYGKVKPYNPLNYELMDEMILTSANVIVPVIGLGLGGFTFYTKEEFELSVDMDYVFTMASPNSNEYNYNFYGTERIKTFKGINKDGGLLELSCNSHEVTPSLNGSWSKENLSFSFSLGLGFEFSSLKSNQMGHSNFYSGYDYNGTLYKDGTEANEFVFAFAPSLALGAQWQVASKLVLNIGGYLAPGAIISTTTESSEYDGGVSVYNSSTKSVKTEFGDTECSLHIGAKFSPINNFSFEAGTGIGYNSNDNSISVFDADNGLFSFFQILASLKF